MVGELRGSLLILIRMVEELRSTVLILIRRFIELRSSVLNLIRMVGELRSTVLNLIVMVGELRSSALKKNNGFVISLQIHSNYCLKTNKILEYWNNENKRLFPSF